MAILGYNTKDTSSGLSLPAARLCVTQFTLGSAQVLNELHGWFSGSSSCTVRLVIYADSAGAPGARVAYTGVKTLTGVDVEIQETGFSNSLAAGNYWIGADGITSDGSAFLYGNASGTSFYKDGAANPPPDPAGSLSSLTRKVNAWAVVVPASSTWNSSSTVSLTDTVTTAGTSHPPAKLGASFVAETVTVTTAGATRLALAPRSPGSLTLVPLGALPPLTLPPR